MTILDLLNHLETKQIRLSLDGGELVVNGRKADLDAELVVLLREKKQELIAHLQQINSQGEPAAQQKTPLIDLDPAERALIEARVPGGAANIEDIYPLAPLQEGIFFHTLLAGEADPYLQSFLIATATRNEADRYLAALQRVVARHDILRTGFFWEGLRQSVQVVVRDAELRIRDITLDPGREAVASLYDQVQPARYRMAPDEAPLMHVVRAYDAGRNRWLLLHLYHHLINDHTTVDLLYQEIRAVIAGREAELPAPRPFRDFVAQSRSPIAIAAHSRFFTEMLGDLDETTAPFGIDRAVGEAGDIEEARITLDLGLERRLRQVAQRAGTGLATITHLAWALVAARTTGRQDVAFGTVLFGRSLIDESQGRMLGPAFNTLPLRLQLEGVGVAEALQRTHDLLGRLMQHDDASLALAQQCSAVPAPQPLFSSILNYRHNAEAVGALEADGIGLIRADERTDYPFYIAVDDAGTGLRLTVQTDGRALATRVVAMVERALLSLAEALEVAPKRPALSLEVLPEAERLQLIGWNPTELPEALGIFLHQEVEAQATRAPEAPAIRFQGSTLSFGALNARANRLARQLRARGVGPEDRVAVCLERTPAMIVALLAVMKAGAAYLPLDPAYPEERLRFVLADAGARLVITEQPLAARLGDGAAQLLLSEAETETGDASDLSLAETGLRPEHLAYVIYTSGSTGTPKGVMIEHRALQSFCAAMDEVLDDGKAPQDWLALTSFSFDISILELLWPLRHGSRIELADTMERLIRSTRRPARLRQFSLFFFAAEDDGQDQAPYRLLTEAAHFADTHGFDAVWTPERHFHAFGGLYPNPSVIGGALAATTRNIEIRAGSIVLPLHDPLRVAEEWAVVDNLSGGRVALSLASGWNADDFTLMPDGYDDRRTRLSEGIETLRALWRGDKVERRNGAGEPVAVGIQPRPVQPELKIWLTAAGNPETFRKAGELGAHVLTHMLGQDHAVLAANIALYREAYRAAGHAGDGHVTLMLHTFVGSDPAEAHAIVREPFLAYLAQSADLMKAMSKGLGFDPDNLSPPDIRAISEHAFTRYYRSHSLLGDAKACRARLEDFDALGIDEVACLIDFGVPFERTMAGLDRLAALREAWLGDLADPAAEPALPQLQCTPSVAAALLDRPWGQGPAFARILVGGEALSADLAVRLQRLSAGDVLNMYGPTETTIWSAMHRCAGIEAGAVPIGRPLANSRIYILDAGGHPAPIGVAGEIWIGGAGVARGYLNRPELTAERFQPDPFVDAPGARIYKTGDLGRWRPDGSIDFLGRADFQVKIRGFRIELGEIEARLLEHPEVKEAVVVAREDSPGDKRLTAYLVAGPGAAPEAETLRAHLATHLPQHMLPAAFVRLERLPLSPSGKLDRRALPAPDAAAFATIAFEPPEGEAETLIATIWQELLGRDRVGRHDNFFALGGNSLLVVSMVGRLRKHGLQADIRAVFDVPTPAGLAQSLGRAEELAIPPNAIPQGCRQITPAMLPLIALTQAEIDEIAARVPGGAENVQDIYPLVPFQEGIFFHTLLAQQGDPYLLTDLLGFDSRERLDAYIAALRQVIGRHDILRTAVLWENLSAPVQVVLRTASLQVEELQLDAAEDPRKTLLAQFDNRHFRIDLGQAPLLRLVIARDTSADRWLLLQLQHHLIGDYGTQKIIQEEIAALQSGADLPAPQPFRNLVARIRLGTETSGQETFFRGMLGDFDEPTAPFGLTALESDGSESDESVLDVDPDLARRIRAAAQSYGVTAASLCHFAWAQVLARTSGRQDIVFGTVLFGRVQGGHEVERALGPVMNTLPLRLKLEGVAVTDGVQALHRTLADLLRHADAPLPLAQRCSGVPAPHPLFTALFNYRYAEPTDIEAGGVLPGLTPMASHHGTNYPLYLAVDDAGAGFRLTVQTDGRILATRVATMVERALLSLAEALEVAPARPALSLEVLPETERLQLIGWNPAELPAPSGIFLHQEVEAQAARAPEAPAIRFQGTTLSYGALNARANRLARQLRARGVGPEDRVAVCLERTPAMIVALLAVTKAGAAYLPLDPAYPEERLRFVLADAGARLVITEQPLAARLGDGAAQLLLSDAETEPGDASDLPPAETGLRPENLAYVIYTSGSTGTPKGVMVEHRALQSFCAAMDEVFDDGKAPQDWLALTSFSFDISILELLWPLRHGSRIELADTMEQLARNTRRPARLRQFSLFFFAAEDDSQNQVPYRLLTEAARFADTHGFDAVWTSARHFHPFGGNYSNPSVIGAALAATTRNVEIRAGSVVMPMHDPLRVAEEWAVVDNLSGGRVALSLASGSNADDFTLVSDGIETLRALWRGDKIERRNGVGEQVAIGIHPRPVQPELKIWLTAGNPETFRKAGELGAHVLTQLLGQDHTVLAANIALYREAWRAAGHAGEGHVTLMLHTFIGSDAARLEEFDALGIDEIACLIDFGVPFEQTMAGLDRLAALREAWLGDLADPAETILPQLQCTPSVAAALLDRDWGPEPAFARILLGGEALSADLAAQLQRLSAGDVINGYGPTETTIYSTMHRFTGLEAGAVPIGRPTANARIYIVDAGGRPAPIGVAGEIWIGGAGVARGYLNRPELTAERFQPDPFVDAHGARIYKTGDLGRWRPDGAIEFLGRADFQVKIRGFRIELGEIEARLLDHPAVREAVVIAREDSPGDKRLTAYLVAATGTTPEAEAVTAEVLRAHLATTLPEHMLPAAFVQLDRLPLTHSGKLDRQALPAPDVAAFATATFEPPEGEAETLIASIWQELLGVDRVGRHDNFFALGGNSLLAVRVIARLRQKRGIELPLAELFAQPTLARLAQALPQAPASRLPAIVPVDRGAPLPLSFAQQRLWFLAQIEGSTAAYHIGAGLRLSGRLDRAALKRALDRILARHEALRTRFVPQDGSLSQHIDPPETGFALSEHDLTADPDQPATLARIAAEEAAAPFDLAAGPLIRGRLIRTAPAEHILLLTLHHIVADGWSVGVLKREFAALYAAFAQGQNDPLPPLAVQYADYALWQRQHLGSTLIETQAGFWQQQLAGAPARLDLPADRRRPAVQDYAGARLPFALDAGLTAKLRALGQRHGATLFMTLMAGFVTLLARLSGEPDIVIGTPVANRLRREVEPLIGLFINTLALRTDLTDDPSVAELLTRIRATTLAAQAHQDIPFEQIVELLRPERSLAHSPVFQVMLSWQNTGEVGLALPGLALELLMPERGTAKFDLTLDLTETAGGVEGFFEYATALFDRPTIERYAGQLQNLLEAMVADEQAPVSTLADRYLAVAEWNATAAVPRELLGRKALPVPNEASWPEDAYVAPVGMIEQSLADIWSELLSVGPVSRHHSFFDLGGHSLLALRMLEELRHACGVEADLRDLFAHPKLSDFSDAIMRTMLDRVSDDELQTVMNANFSE